MSDSSLLTILDESSNPAHDSYVEKKSEFIGDACHVSSLDEALDFVASIREQHPRARHVAYVAIVGSHTSQLSERMSDDGEPSGTAGKPILNVLRSQNLTDCVVCVTRYFGGILLGSGGLVRAYSTGASLALSKARMAEVGPCTIFCNRITYSQHATMRQLIEKFNGNVTNEDFTDAVSITFSIPDNAVDAFNDTVRQTFQAAIIPQKVGAGSSYVPVALTL